jgi:hypothetical protein
VGVDVPNVDAASVDELADGAGAGWFDEAAVFEWAHPKAAMHVARSGKNRCVLMGPTLHPIGREGMMTIVVVGCVVFRIFRYGYEIASLPSPAPKAAVPSVVRSRHIKGIKTD